MINACVLLMLVNTVGSRDMDNACVFSEILDTIGIRTSSSESLGTFRGFGYVPLKN
ncbi:hypothetical protein CIPAW_08G076600 [Carya illinoinensis]|uniref:Uncharacterized protein n=1 Tax=Carya illinoinensis TaxID=32201 RepID=A0A8T1PV65_CARIL|nr:hypothetical protein CIPAW_08G076600 [Carya illinoinensis]